MVLGSGPNYTIYGGDVSAYAGRSGELRFTANTISPSTWGSALDNIFFSRLPVPEPTICALFTIAGLLFSGRLMNRCRVVGRSHARNALVREITIRSAPPGCP